MDSSFSREQARTSLEGLAAQKIEYAPFYAELAEAWMEQASILLEEKRSAASAFQKAEASVDQAIIIKPNYSWAYVTRGKHYRMMATSVDSANRLKKAEEALRHAIQIKPDHAEAYCTLAMVQMQLARHEKEPERRAARLSDARTQSQRAVLLNRLLQPECSSDEIARIE